MEVRGIMERQGKTDGKRAANLIQKIVFELGRKNAIFEKSWKAHGYWVKQEKWHHFFGKNKSVSILL